MPTVTVTELAANLPAIIADMDATGLPVHITRHGTYIAVLAPLPTDTPRRSKPVTDTDTVPGPAADTAADPIAALDLTAAAAAYLDDTGAPFDDTVTPSRVTNHSITDRAATPRAVASLTWIRALPDAVLLDAARTFVRHERPNAMHQLLHSYLGASTNPDWITAQCAEAAYERDLIDETELDYLTR